MPPMFRFISLLLVTLFLAGAAMGQAGGSTADIQGRVLDPTVPCFGATVTLTDSDRGTSRTATTNSQGEYRFLALTPGVYSVRVEASGFSTQLQNDVAVTVGQTLDQVFNMQIGDATATVEITGDPPLSNWNERSNRRRSTNVHSRTADRPPRLPYIYFADAGRGRF